MKKIAILVLFLMVLQMFCVQVAASPVGGSCGAKGDSVNWTFDLSAKSLVISGTGKMKDYNSIGDPAWSPYEEYIEKIFIEEGVTRIGDNAFANCENVNYVSLSQTLTSIGYDAFGDNVYQIAEEEKGVYYLDKWILCVDDYATSLQLRDDTIAIADSAFAGCRLTAVTLPNSVKYLGVRAFLDCDYLKTVQLSANMKQIESETFSGCDSLQSIIIPDGVTTIGMSAFERCCMLKDVSIPSSVTKIDRGAFEECTALSSIVIPEGVVQIMDHAFSFCSKLETVVIPKSTTYIDAYAFSMCRNMKLITYNGSRKEWNAMYKDSYWMEYNVDYKLEFLGGGEMGPIAWGGIAVAAVVILFVAIRVRSIKNKKENKNNKSVKEKKKT